MRLLITGVTGQDGYYLADQALQARHEVYGLVHGQNNPKEADLRRDLPSVKILYGDLLDSYSINEAVQWTRPDVIVNLGAITYVPMSWEQPNLALRTITEGALNVLNAAKSYGCAVVQASTSEMFGNAHEPGQAVNENSVMRPASPYGTAKLAAHHLVRNYRDAHGTRAVSAIMFNHESPRRPTSFVTRKITHTIAQIMVGQADMLKLGNTESMRDWGFAGDYMLGVLMIAEKLARSLGPYQTREAYTLATGEAVSVKQWAEYAWETAHRLTGLDLTRELHIFSNTLDQRPSDVNYLRGDASAMREDFGWQPGYDWKTLCTSMVRHDLELLGYGNHELRA